MFASCGDNPARFMQNAAATTGPKNMDFAYLAQNEQAAGTAQNWHVTGRGNSAATLMAETILFA
jgi:hypothetical protein